MRSNLLSLRETARLQEATQLRLSTGLKVNSAIDNPSSYYTANALTNRANDLSALLDSMGQGIQTIKAATKTLDKAAEFLQQISSVATQAVDHSLAKKEVSLEILKEKGAKIATTKSELKSQLNSAQAGDVIIVMGTIEMGDESLTVKAGVTLGGAQYAVEKYGLSGQFKAENKAVINFERKSTTEAKGIIMESNARLSDLEANLSTDYTGNNGGAVFIINATGVKLHNIDLSINSNRAASNSFFGAITNSRDSETELNGNINIKTSGGSMPGIVQQRYFNISTLRIDKNANVNIETRSERSGGIVYGNLYSEGNITIKTSGLLGHGFEVESISVLGGNIDVWVRGPSTLVVKEKLNIASSAKFMMRSDSPGMLDKATNVAVGAIIGEYKNGQYNLYQALTNNVASNSTNFATSSDYKKSDVTYERVRAEMDAAKHPTDDEGEGSDYYVSDIYNQPFNNILSQYDLLINDGSYKGINLLQKDDLKVRFNEDDSTKLLIRGKDATAQGLGLKTADWKTLRDVENSLSEISKAVSSIRSMTSEFGNYYSALNERQSFTENMINILNEGSDKLRLADINEESANMLALETRQQLAVNSLSLASQSSQSIFKLF